ncbi:MAG: hypothetical protein HY461_00240 [Parcubacteria group bacterium]|nr:hypothetical protein [Parcubacteria group bacterium]
MPSAPSFSTTLLSALGWFAAVLAVALALFVGKPHYQQVGYDEGRRVQAASNIKKADEALSQRTIEGEEFPVYGRVVERLVGALVMETLTPALNNPLREKRRRQTVVIASQTVLEKRTLTNEIETYKTEPLTLADFQIGQEIIAFPASTQDALLDQFIAKRIIQSISLQQSL